MYPCSNSLNRLSLTAARVGRCSCLFISFLHLEFLEGKTHRAFAIVCASSIFVFFDDEFLCKFEEGVVDVGPILGTCLDDWDLRMLLLKLLDLLVCHLYICFIIHFISKDHDFDVTARVLLDLVKPDRDAKKTFTVCQIEDYDYSISALVVRIRDRSVSLLSRRVPNLQLNSALIDLECAEAEVDPNSANVILLEAIILLD